MKTIEMLSAGVSHVTETDVPAYNDDQILVRVTLTGICHSEYFPWLTAKAGQRFGHEAVGVVEAVGKNVTGWKKGDRITGLGGGGYKEYIVMSKEKVCHVPDGLADDIILEPGEKAVNLPPWLPLFTGLEGKGSWTLSCIPYLGRSDIRISADLKQWDFRPEPLEEYTFVIQSGEQIWKKVDVRELICE